MSAAAAARSSRPDPAELRRALAEPVVEITRELAGIDLVPMPGAAVPREARVRFSSSGAPRARLLLGFEGRLARRLTAGLYAGMGLLLEPGEEGAALAELGNCYMGHIDGRLAGLELDLGFSTPEIVHECEPAEPTGPDAQIVLGSEAGALGIALHLLTTTGRHDAMTGRISTTLIVDDSAPMRRALRGILERSGLKVIGEAGNGIEAIKLVRELKPDLVTMDIVMPQMDGVQTLRAIHELHPEARVVMVTAMTSLSKVQECRRFGATHYIVKPFEEAKVREVLSRILMGAESPDPPPGCGA